MAAPRLEGRLSAFASILSGLSAETDHGWGMSAGSPDLLCKRWGLPCDALRIEWRCAVSGQSSVRDVRDTRRAVVLKPEVH